MPDLGSIAGARLIPGRATPDGTRRYAERFPEATGGYFRMLQGLSASSIGLGTYPGRPDESTDRGYSAAVSRAMALGCNLLDTAVPYRHQRSERVVGSSLLDLLSRGLLRRDEVIIGSKAGFLPFDGHYRGGVGTYYEETFIRTGIVTAADFVAPGHCIAPRFLRHQIETSRRNLACATIDLFYVHNVEVQLADTTRPGFHARVRAAFEALEDAVRDGRVAMYGVSTWTGLRVPPGSPDYLSLLELMRCARDVAGNAHHFRVVMLPVNLVMREGLTLRSQQLEGRSACSSAVAAAEQLGLSVLAASALHGGRLPSAAALQFVRSIPEVTTALVGMSDPKHVDENLALARIPPMPDAEEGRHTA